MLQKTIIIVFTDLSIWIDQFEEPNKELYTIEPSMLIMLWKEPK